MWNLKGDSLSVSEVSSFPLHSLLLCAVWVWHFSCSDRNCARAATAMATESIFLKPVSFAWFTKNPLNQFHKRRQLSYRIRRFRFGVICSKSSDYQDFQSYARPLRLLPAEEVKVFRGNPSFTTKRAIRYYRQYLQICHLWIQRLWKMVKASGFRGALLMNSHLKDRNSAKSELFGLVLSLVSFFCYRYDFEVDELLLGESSDLSMVELRPSRITELADSDQISSSSALNLDRTMVSNEESMEEYANLKLSLLLYDAVLILLGSLVFSFSLGENSAIAFFFGGTMGFLYLLLLQRSVDELQVPGSSSSENSNQILSGGLKIPVLSLALAIGLTVLAMRGHIGGEMTAFAVTPKEIVVGTLGFLVCKVAVILAAFKPLKDGP